MSLAVAAVPIIVFFAGFNSVRADDGVEAVNYGGVMWPQSADYPLFVQLVGSFSEPSEKEKTARLTTITVTIDNNKKKWLFTIKKAVDMAGDLTQLSVINNIWPPTLSLWGSDTVLAPILKPDIAGKQFLIEGPLNLSNNILEVEEVKDLSSKTETKEEKKE